jgi:hypothetical protein
MSEWSTKRGYKFISTGGPPFALELCVKKVNNKETTHKCLFCIL